MTASKRFHLRKIKWFLILVGFIPLFLFPQIASASTLSLSPGSGNIYLGSTKTVSVILNTGGEAVNAVSAYLSYPADKLDVAWVSAGRAFSIEAENSYGGGAIKISRGNFSGVSGSVTVATIGFRGKAAGSATVSFIGGSAAPRLSDSSDSLNLGGSRGGTFAVGGSAPSQKPSPVGTPGVEQQNIPLVISNLKIASVASNSAVITWQTNENSDSLVEYGLEADKYFLNASSNQPTKEHSIKLESSLFVPGLLLHFKVTSKNDSSVISSNDTVLQLPGYSIKVKVTDQSGNSITGTNVTLYSLPMKGVTNQQGEVSFKDVTPGKHVVRMQGIGMDKSSEIEVKEASMLSAPQDYTIQIEVSSVGFINNIFSSKLFYAGIIVILLIAFVGGFFFWRRNRVNKNPVVAPPVSQDQERNMP